MDVSKGSSRVKCSWSYDTDYEGSFEKPVITGYALQRVSQELDYRIDICRVTKGAHIENL
jgi:hypothetical protein